MKFTKLALAPLVLAAGLVLSACQSTGMGTNQTFGTLIGAGGGALAGSQFGSGNGRLVATAVGTLVGAGIGNQIGRSMDQVDQMYHSRNTVNALQEVPNGHTSNWQNPQNGHSGSTTPTRTYVSPNGTTCRDYTSSIVVDGRLQTMNGRACQNPNTGEWYAN